MFDIRPYSEKDAEGVIKLWFKVFPESSEWNIPDEDIKRKLKIQRELFIVAEIDEKVIGTAMAGYDGHRGWVYYVAVHPDYRRQGVGRTLMKKVEVELSEMGCPKLNLQVRGNNRSAVEFYKNLGYVVEDRVSMGKRLD
jgi:hypothetical protein